jgi:hypothetical protein
MGSSLPPINSSLMNSAPPFNPNTEVCLILHSGQSNSEAVAAQAGTYPSSYPNVRGLSAASNLSVSLSDVTWSNWTNSPVNFSLGRQGYAANLTNILHEFNAQWQTAINGGQSLPDLYCVHIPWSGEGIGAASDAYTTNSIYNGSNQGSATSLWNVLARESSIAGTPLSIYDLAYFQQYIVQMAIRNLIKTTGKSVRFLGYVWVQGEQDSKVLVNAQAYQREFGIILNSINSAAGTKVPFYPVMLRSNDGQANGRFLYPSNINAAFSNLVAWQGNGSSVIDPLNTPGAVPITAAQLIAAGVTNGTQAQAYMIAQGQIHNPIIAADYNVSQSATVGNAPPIGGNAGTTQGNVYIYDGATWGVHYSQAALKYMGGFVFSRVTNGFTGPVIIPNLPSTYNQPNVNLFDPQGIASNAGQASANANAASAAAGAVLSASSIPLLIADLFAAQTVAPSVQLALTNATVTNYGTGTASYLTVIRDSVNQRKYASFITWNASGQFSFMKANNAPTDTLYGGLRIRFKGNPTFAALLRVITNGTPANTFQSTGLNYLAIIIGTNVPTAVSATNDFYYTNGFAAGSQASPSNTTTSSGNASSANSAKVTLLSFDPATTTYYVLDSQNVSAALATAITATTNEVDLYYSFNSPAASGTTYGTITVSYALAGSTTQVPIYTYTIPNSTFIGSSFSSGGTVGVMFGLGNRPTSAINQAIRISQIAFNSLE